MKSNGIPKVTVHTLAQDEGGASQDLDAHRLRRELRAARRSGGRRHHPRRRFARHGGAGRRQHAAGHDGRDGLPLSLGRARHRARAGRRRHAVHVVPGVDRRRHSQRRPPGEGGRRRGGQARGRRRVRRARGAPRRDRHPGHGPHRAHAAVGARDGRLQGAGPRRRRRRKKLLDDARALEQAGCYAIVLEGIPRELAREITDGVSIPTIGIGAGVALRRPGAGHLRPARHERGVPPEVRQALRQPRGPHPHRRRAVHHRSAQRAVPRRGAQLLQGGAAAARRGDALQLAHAPPPAAAAPSAIPTPPAPPAFRCRSRRKK